MVVRTTERSDEVVAVVRSVVVVGVDVESVKQLVLPLLDQSSRDKQERVLNLTGVDEPRELQSDFDGLPQPDLVTEQEIVRVDGDCRVRNRPLVGPYLFERADILGEVQSPRRTPSGRDDLPSGSFRDGRFG